MPGPANHNTLSVRRLGIDTYQEAVIYLRKDCPACQSEGFEAQSRINVALNSSSIIATLNVVTSDLLQPHEAGLSEFAWRVLDPAAGDQVQLSHPMPLESLGHVRAKVYGNRLNREAFSAIIGDVARGRYSDLHLAAFISACAGDRLDIDETVFLTEAMIASGQRLSWSGARIMDKHSVGGLPGNRTTLLVVPIVAACGLTIPKTSSRAITSPAGTADTMETLAPVMLDLAAMRRVVEREGGCIAWGGAVMLSPADDMLIRVARPLDLDSQGQLVSSVLSKKAAAGVTDVIIDIPTGPTAKVRTAAAARELQERLVQVGRAIGLNVFPLITDGSQPVGRGIGPALEAHDALAVLRNETGAPADLRERAMLLAGRLLELGGRAPPGEGIALAGKTLADGSAWRKFQGICEAQGGMRAPPRASHTHVITSAREGRVALIDNRRLARIAKLAGAPKAPAAGVEVHAPHGTVLAAGQPLFTIHAQTPGELAYAVRYAASQPDVIAIENAA